MEIRVWARSRSRPAAGLVGGSRERAVLARLLMSASQGLREAGDDEVPLTRRPGCRELAVA